MSVEGMPLFGLGDNGAGNVILLVALIAVVLLLVFIWKSFAPKPKRAADGTTAPRKKPKSKSGMKPAMTAEDVVSKRFQPTKPREGYDQQEVDAFLDKIVREFQRLQEENEHLHLKKANSLGESVSITAPVVTAKQVVLHDFPPSRSREGYSPDDVDDFLDKVVIGLSQWTAENEELRAELTGNPRS